MARKTTAQKYEIWASSSSCYLVLPSSAIFTHKVVNERSSSTYYDTTLICEPSSDEAQYLMARLAEEVVHQMRNPLCAIKGFIAMAQDEPTDFAYWKQLILAEVSQMEAVLRNFSVLAGEEYEQRETSDLRELVARAVEVQAPASLASGVWLTLTAARSFLPVKVNRERFCLAISHILTNAVEASSPGQVVHIEVGKSGEKGLIRVINSTPALTWNETSRFQQPFYTTKEGHAGLGLTIVERIMSGYGGSLEIENRDPDGFITTLSLPLS